MRRIAALLCAAAITASFCIATGCSSKKNTDQSNADVQQTDRNELILQAVNIISVSSAGAGNISVSWSKVENAAGYQVEYCTEKEFDGAASVDADSSDMTSTTVDGGLVVGMTYYFRVRAYTKDDDGNMVYGEWSEVSAFELTPETVELTSVSSPESGKISVSWNKDEAVAGYQVDYSADEEFNDVLSVDVNSANEASITFGDGLVVGNTYYIRVRAYGNDIDGNKVYGGWSEISAFELIPAIVELKSVSSPESGEITASWSKDENVAGYQVQYSTDKKFKDVLSVIVKSADETSVNIDDGIVVGRTYYIRVRAYGNNVDGDKIYGGWSKVSDLKLTPTTVELKSVSSPESGKISASWSKDISVAGYQVQYSSDATFNDALAVDVNSSDKTSVTFNNGIVVGRTYYIRVRAYGEDIEGNKVYGGWSNVSDVQLTPKKVKLTSVYSSRAGKLTVYWSKDSSVAGYQVQYSSDAKFNNAFSVDVNSYDKTNAAFDEGLSTGNTYYIRVRAYGKDISGNKVYGGWSNVAAYKLDLNAPDITDISSGKSGTITASWSKISNISGYQLIYSTDSQFTDSTTLDNGSPSDTSVTFSKGLVVGRTYSIRVRTYTKTSDGVTLYGCWSKVYTYQLMPKKPSITSVRSPWTKYILIDWSKDESVAGYQLSYSTNSDFSGAKTVNFSSSGETSTTFHDELVVGNTYYFRVRTYGKDIDGNKVYSDWSKTETIKCEVINGIEVADLVTAVNGSVIKDTAAWSGKTLASFSEGDILNKISTSGNWVMVEYNGTIGYVYNKTFKNTANYTAITTATLPTVADDWLFDNGTSIKTIYDFAYSIRYTASAPKESIEEMSVRAFKLKNGACYHHAAIFKYLLERVGYEVQYVEGQSKGASGNSVHAWTMVKTSDGWRHFDPTSFLAHSSVYNATDTEAASYLIWDKDKYPAAK